jgi:hypothetical protein
MLKNLIEQKLKQDNKDIKFNLHKEINRFVFKIAISTFIFLILLLAYCIHLGVSFKKIRLVYIYLLIFLSIFHISWIAISSYYFEIKKNCRKLNQFSLDNCNELERKYYILTRKINRCVYISIAEIIFILLTLTR